MNRLYFFFLLIFILVPFSYVVNAQDLDPASVTNSLSGKTFWNKSNLNRYSFVSDGTFKQQFISQEGSYSPGTTLAGTWQANDSNNQVCWTYTIENNVLNNQEYCFTYELDTDAPRIWNAYDQTINMYTQGDDGSRQLSFEWNRWMYGDLIIEPGIAKNMNARILEMAKISMQLNQSKIKTKFPINPKANLSDDMRQYADSIVGKIMKLPLGNIFHTKDGRSYSIPEKLVGAVSKDATLLTDNDFMTSNNIATGEQWFLDDNIQCWFYVMNGASECTLVYPASILDMPTGGYIHILDDGFIRHVRP